MLCGIRLTSSTQGNYATRGNNGMCHLMPRRQLPEWWEEDGWAFVHCGSRIPNKDLDNTMPATVNCITRSHYKVMDDTLESSVTVGLRCNSMISTWTATVYKCLLTLLSPLSHVLPWHMPLLSWVAWFPCVASSYMCIDIAANLKSYKL